MNSAGPVVRFRILGPIEVGAPMRGPGQLALLAYLLVHANRAVSTDQLIDALWSDQPAAGALKRLQVAVTRLRGTLEPGTLRTVSGGYLLAVGPGELDADVFRARVHEGQRALDAGRPAMAAGVLREGLAMWRGPPLADVAFVEFAQAEIRRLEALHLDAIELMLDAELACGRHREALADIEALVDDQPLREHPRAQQMLALYRSGRQADALTAFQAQRQTLVDQFGIEPGRDLCALHAAILRQDPALDTVAVLRPS